MVVRNRALRVLIALMVLSLAAGMGLAEKPKIDSSRITIVAFGDSTTALRDNLTVYADRLQKSLPEAGLDAQVINAGVPGNTTKQALKRLRDDVLRHEPSLVIIQFGINDSAVDVWKDPPADEPRVLLAEYEKNLRRMIGLIQSRDSKVIMMTPNPLAWTEELRKRYGKPPYNLADEDGFNVTLEQYVAAVKEIGEEENVPVIDMYKAFQSQDDCSPGDLLLDGIHPNNRGQRLAADLLLKKISKIIDVCKRSEPAIRALLLKCRAPVGSPGFTTNAKVYKDAFN